MTEPQTAAGRALLRTLDYIGAHLADTSFPMGLDDILAIEAEARAAALDAHRPGIVADEDDTDWRIVCSCGWDGPWTNAGHAAIDALIAAVRAEYAEWVDPYRYETDTAMDYGHGLRDGRAESAETLRALPPEEGEGYEVRVWQPHRPSKPVVLPGHPQLGGRYCTTDGADWPCDALRAALAATPAER